MGKKKSKELTHFTVPLSVTPLLISLTDLRNTKVEGYEPPRIKSFSERLIDEVIKEEHKKGI